MKKNISLIIISIVIIVLIGAIYIIKRQDKVSLARYEVITPNEGDKYISLNVLDKINLKKLTNNLLKREIREDILLSELNNINAFKSIVNILKDYDDDFKEVNYKVSFNFPYEDKTSYFIDIGYYIGNLIETNKGYIINVENNKIKDITLAGVTKKNIDHISLTNEEVLIKLAKEFIGDKKTSALLKYGKKNFKNNEILNEYGTVKKESLKGDIINIDEKFQYDYNSQKLKFILLFCEKFSDVSDCSSIKIDLN